MIRMKNLEDFHKIFTALSRGEPHSWWCFGILGTYSVKFYRKTTDFSQERLGKNRGSQEGKDPFSVDAVGKLWENKKWKYSPINRSFPHYPQVYPQAASTKEAAVKKRLASGKIPVEKYKSPYFLP